MADDSRLSAVIDDEGRLFGVVNVIDVLVILLVFAMVAAGLALVGGGGTETAETRYATIDLGTYPDYVAEQITDGDEWTPQGGRGSLTVTNVFMAPAGEGERRVTIRAAINGTATDPEAGAESPIQFAGTPLRFGRTLTIETNEYVVEGTVTDIGQTEPLGVPATQTVTVEVAEISQARAERLAVGVTEIMGETETATIVEADAQPARAANDTQLRDVTLAMELNVRVLEDDTVLFRGEELRLEDELLFELGNIRVEGRVTDLGE